MKIVYGILVAINAIVLAVLLFFFLWGIQDGSVSAFNILLWLVMLAVPSAMLAGGLLCWRKGQRAPAILLLLVPALPGFLFAVFFGALIVFQPDWR